MNSPETLFTCSVILLTLCPLFQAIFVIRPFLDPKTVDVDIPRHNFWPWIPVADPLPSNETYYEIPHHHFWPFIPIWDPNLNGSQTPEPPTTTPYPDEGESEYDYGEVLYKSILFFEAQRSGWLPDDRRVGWRGHSALGDRGINGEDLTGGWYDAGDYVKFGLPMASAATMLLWGLAEFKDGYEAVGLLEDMYDCVRWPLDYFMKAHPSKYEFYAMVGDPYLDHSYWGRPEDMSMARPSYRLSPDSPGSDVAGESAAALAAGYVVFKDRDEEYAKQLLSHAEELFEFSESFQGKYSDSLPIVQEFYESSGFADELAWAAAWLWKATGDKKYKDFADKYYEKGPAWSLSWDDKRAGAMVLLYQLSGQPQYREDIEATLADWLPGGTVPYTPKGLAIRLQWGALRYTGNMATMALAAANAGLNPVKYRRWARQQIHYMLGDGGRSYVVGFGYDPPLRPHHASSSCNPPPWPCTWDDFLKPEPNVHTLYGALVGGPDMDDYYSDDRGDYIHSEVTCDYNSGFHSAVAGLQQDDLRRQRPLR